MPTRVKLALHHNPLLRIGWRLCLVAVMAGYLLTGTPADAFDRFSCHVGSSSNGETFVSCGSSAGNFVYTCNETGCHDQTDPNNQWIADGLCQQYAAEGCPGNYW